MELRHLRYFLAVAEHLNFGRAALSLRTAQPGLSQQIRHLERELGGALFERTKRYVALTELGRELLIEAQGIVEAADQLLIRVRDSSTVPRGRLRVGSIMPATLGVLPSVLPSYREAFPLVELSVATVGLDEQIRALLERRIDVGVLRGPIPDERIHSSRIANEYFCVSVPANHPLASRARISPRDLNGETFLALTSDRGGSFNDDAFAMLRKARVRPMATVDVADVAAVFALVASGAGISLSSTVWTNVAFAGVVHRPLVPATPIDTMMLAWRADRRTVPVVRSFIEHLATMDLTFAAPT